MFKKEYVFDKPNFYENILKNTYEKSFSADIFLRLMKNDFAEK